MRLACVVGGVVSTVAEVNPYTEPVYLPPTGCVVVSIEGDSDAEPGWLWDGTGFTAPAELAWETDGGATGEPTDIEEAAIP